MNRHESDQQYDPLDRRPPPPPRARRRRKRLESIPSGEMAMIRWRAHLDRVAERDFEWKPALIRAAVLIAMPLLVLLIYFSFLAGATLKLKTAATPKPKKPDKIVWVKIGDGAATPGPEKGEGK